MKITEQTQFCQGCHQAHNCRHIYEQLGTAEGPSVTVGAIVAFLVPILAFVGALGLSGRLLRALVGRAYETPVAVIVATCLTGALMLVVRAMARRPDQDRRAQNVPK